MKVYLIRFIDPKEGGSPYGYIDTGIVVAASKDDIPSLVKRDFPDVNNILPLSVTEVEEITLEEARVIVIGTDRA